METSIEQDPAPAFAPPMRISTPFFVTLAGVGLVMFCVSFGRSFWPAITGMIFYGVSLIWLLAQTLRRLVAKQWVPAVTNSLCLLLCLGPGFMAATGVASILRFFRSEDGFAKGLTIPAGLEISEPLPEIRGAPGETEDSFQKAILAASFVPPTSDPCVAPSASSLRALAFNDRPLLMQYLALSPAWRVFEQNGVLCATRRWRIGRMWLWNMHGYYSPHSVGRWTGGPLSSFQVRTTIGLDGKPWASGQGLLWMEEGTSAQPVRLDKRWAFDSHIAIRCGGVALELFEQSQGPERRLTKAALRELETEFKALLDRKDSVRTLLPVDSVRPGTPLLKLYNASQPGMYDTEIWVNPGESGLVYLKAYEVTRGTRLSARDLRKYSNERTGWSEDPNELFYSNGNVTIYEGDWGQPYAARFELWFIPDSGQGERKLLERVFKIEGWQR